MERQLETKQSGSDQAWIIVVGADLRAHLNTLVGLAQATPERVLFLLSAANTPAVVENIAILKRLCSRAWPRLRLIVPAGLTGFTGKNVLAQIQDWQHFRPELITWNMDVSSLAFNGYAGIGQILRALPDLKMFAIGDTSGWHQITMPESELAFSAVESPVDVDGLAKVSLMDLLSSISEPAATILWRESRAGEKLSPAEIAAIIADGIKKNWSWSSMYETALGRLPDRPDYGVKDIIASALLALGVENVRIDVRLRLEAYKEEPFLFDVVACHNGSFFVFNCQAENDANEGVTRAAVQDAVRQFFDKINVVSVVLRPLRWASGAERAMELAAQGAYIWDADACRTVFTRLAKLLNVRTPVELRVLERQGMRFRASRLPVLAAATAAQRLGNAVQAGERIFDLVRGARVDGASGAAPWHAARLTPDTWFIEGKVIQGGMPAELRRRLEARFANEKLNAKILYFELSANQRYWHVLIRTAGDTHQFQRWLKNWNRLPILV